MSALGCKLNESELEAWARRFAEMGSEIVTDARAADLIVLNTCTVTHVAARKTRQLARQLARANPRAPLVLTGCFVTISPEEAKALPNVALVVPNASKDQLVEQIANREWRGARGESRESSAMCPQSSAISQLWLDADVETQAAGRESQASDLQSLRLRTRAFVKIQDGCNLACSYCIIPVARGKERSRTRDEIVKDIAALVDAGYKEIVLTGVQISAYRNGEADSRFALRDLVAAILAETNVPRLRLTSIAPWDVDESLLDLWHDARLCRHLHLSLQSGSDPVLHRMKRLYTTAQFARAVESVRAKIPDVGITTDVIVGFPGEDEIEFGQSSKFVERMQFSRVHVFSYSKRTGTSAAALPAQVAEPVKQARAQQMQAIADASLRAFAQRFVGRELTVLWETREDRKGAGERRSEAENSSLLPCAPVPLRYWSGYSDNYIRVVAASDADLTNQFTSARVIEVAGEGVLALL